jgi:transcriptional regulator with XRE-family HTH domain
VQFNEILFGLMQKNGYSNYKLAQMMDISQSTVAYWVDGKGMPQRSKRKQLAEIFGVSVDELMGKTKPPATEGDGQYGLSKAQWKQIGHCFGSKLAEIKKAPAYLATDKTGLSEDEVDAFIRGERYVTKAQIHAMADRMGMELDDIIKGYSRYFEGEEDADIALEAQLLRVLRLLPDADKERLADYARILARSNGLDAKVTAPDE